MAERGQDVVGSDGRCHVPNNHSKYRTSGVPVLTGTPVKLQREHGGPSIEPPDALAGEAFHLSNVRREECPHRAGRLIRPYAGERHPPLRCFQPEPASDNRPPAGRTGSIHAGHLRRLACGKLEHLDHVDPVRQGRVQRVPHVERGTRAGQADLQVLSLARGASRRPARVRNLRVR